jgi:hypothetical protein
MIALILAMVIGTTAGTTAERRRGSVIPETWLSYELDGGKARGRSRPG